MKHRTISEWLGLNIGELLKILRNDILPTLLGMENGIVPINLNTNMNENNKDFETCVNLLLKVEPLISMVSIDNWKHIMEKQSERLEILEVETIIHEDKVSKATAAVAEVLDEKNTVKMSVLKSLISDEVKKAHANGT